MPDSADRRARRKLLAEAYSSLPSREVLQAAAELESAKMQRASQSEQMALQKGSLAVAILSQVPRDDENNRPVFILSGHFKTAHLWALQNRTPQA